MTINKRQSRIPYLDLLKFFAIASVILGHSVEQLTGDDFWDNPLWSFIYTYHMPLFMMLSGYFAGSSFKIPFVMMLKKKSQQLLVPTISVFALMYLIVAFLGYNPSPLFMDFSLTGFINLLWFLKCVLLCYIIGYVFMKFIDNAIVAGIVSSVLFTLLPFGDIANLNFMLPMFWIGYWLNLKRCFVERHTKVLMFGAIIIFVGLLPFWSGRLTVYNIPIAIIDTTTWSIDLYNLYITLYRLIIGVAGSMICFLVAPKVYNLIEGSRILPYLQNIGKCTLGIYIAQTLLLECALNSMGIYLPTLGSLIIAPLVACVEMVLCYNVVLLLKRNKWLRMLFLGEPLQRKEVTTA